MFCGFVCFVMSWILQLVMFCCLVGFCGSLDAIFHAHFWFVRSSDLLDFCFVRSRSEFDFVDR